MTTDNSHIDDQNALIKIVDQNGARGELIREAVTEMEKVNMEYLVSIFRELTTELPKELLYRETDNCIELKSLESISAA